MAKSKSSGSGSGLRSIVKRIKKRSKKAPTPKTSKKVSKPSSSKKSSSNRVIFRSKSTGKVIKAELKGRTIQEAVKQETVKQEQQQQKKVQPTQRKIARQQVGGPIERVVTDPSKKEVTFVGATGKKATFPVGGVSFSGRERPGGIRSEEKPAAPEDKPLIFGRKVVRSLDERLGPQQSQVRQDVIRSEQLESTLASRDRQLEGQKPITGQELFKQRRETQLLELERDIESQKDRQSRFFSSPGMQRIESLSSMLTFGGGRPKEERGEIGFQAQTLVSGGLSFPIAIGGQLASTTEKFFLTGRALGFKETRSNVLPTFGRAFKETAPTFDPTTREGRSTFIAAGTFGLLGASGKLARGRSATITEEVKLDTRTFGGTKVTLEKTAPISKTGTIRTFDTGITLKKPGPLRFEFHRNLLLEKETTPPKVSVTKGTLKVGSERGDISIRSVGRQLEGTIRTKTADILFKKTEAGKLQTTRLARTDIRRPDVPIGGRKTTAFKTQQLSLAKIESGSVVGKGKFLDLGKKVGGSEFFDIRGIEIPKRGKIGGLKTETIRGRAEKTVIRGEAKTKLTQLDIAKPQVEVTKIGDVVTTRFRPSTIERVLQPTFKPDIRFVGSEARVGGPVKVTRFIKRPQLSTKREASFQRRVQTRFTRERVKPIRLLTVSALKLSRRAGETTLSMLRSKKALKTPLTRIERPARVQVKIPKGIEPTAGDAGISPESLLKISELGEVSPKSVFRTGTSGKQFNIGRADPKSEIFPISKGVSKTRTPTISKVFSKSRTRINIRPISKARAETKTETFIRTKARTKTRTQAKIKVKTLTKTLTKTKVPGSPKLSITKVPTVPTDTPRVFLLPAIPKLPRIPKPKRKKKRKILRGAFNPTLEFSERGIFGPTPNVLTGLEARPIPIGRTGMVKI